MTKYDSNTSEGKCIFCEIAKGNFKTPGIFWEDDEFMAFLSIFPNTEGFTVIIPKKHYDSDVLSMPDDKLKDFVIAAKKVSNILIKHFDDVGRVGLMMEGTGINHAHIKLFPMHGTENLKKGEWRQFHSNIDTFFENYEGCMSSNDGPKANENNIKKLADNLRML